MKQSVIQWIALGILIIIGTGVSENMNASESAIQNIRSLYSDYNQQIEQQNDTVSREGPQKMVVTGTVVERAVGPVQKTVTITYDLNETMPEPGRFEANAVARKVIFVEQTAWKTISEYFYDSSGELVFFFQKHEGPHGYPEKRIYYSDEKPVRVVIHPVSPVNDGSFETDTTSEDRSGTRNDTDLSDADRRDATLILADSQVFRQLAVLFGNL
jgi:hypothetical protein